MNLQQDDLVKLSNAKREEVNIEIDSVLFPVVSISAFLKKKIDYTGLWISLGFAVLTIPLIWWILKVSDKN